MSRLPLIEGEAQLDHPSPTTLGGCPDSQDEAACPSWHTSTSEHSSLPAQDVQCPAGNVLIKSWSQPEFGESQQAEHMEPCAIPAALDTPRFQELPSAFTGHPVPPLQVPWTPDGRHQAAGDSLQAVTRLGDVTAEEARQNLALPSHIGNPSPRSFPLPFCSSPRSSAEVLAPAFASLESSSSVPISASSPDRTVTLGPQQSDGLTLPRMTTTTSGSRRKQWAFAHLPLPSKLASRSVPPPSHIHGVLPKVLVPEDSRSQTPEKGGDAQSEPTRTQQYRPLLTAVAGPAVMAEFQDYVCEYIAQSSGQNSVGYPATAASTASGKRDLVAHDRLPPGRDSFGATHLSTKEVDVEGADTFAVPRPLQVPELPCPPPLWRRVENGHIKAMGPHSCPASPGHVSAPPAIVVCPVHGVVPLHASPYPRSSSGRSMQIFLSGSMPPYEALVGPQVSRYFSAPGDMDVECFCGSCPDLSLPMRPSKSLSLNLRPQAASTAQADAGAVTAECEDWAELLAMTPTLHWRRQSDDLANLVNKMPVKQDLSRCEPDASQIDLRAPEGSEAGNGVNGHLGKAEVLQGDASVVFNALPGEGASFNGFNEDDSVDEKEQLFHDRRQEMFSEEWSNMVLTSAITSADPSYDNYNVHNASC